jgi:hypothetical protein
MTTYSGFERQISEILKNISDYPYYKYIKDHFADDYQRIMKFKIGYKAFNYDFPNTIEVIKNEVILLARYRRYEELESFWDNFGLCVTAEYDRENRGYGDGKFLKSFNRELNPIYPYTGDDKIVEILHRRLDASLKEWQEWQDENISDSKNRMDSSLRETPSPKQNGMFNILTGDIVKPRDGGYYIDDFR